MLQSEPSFFYKSKILIFKAFSFLLTIPLLMTTSACARKPPADALEVVLAMTKASPGASAGDVYLLPGTDAAAGLTKAEADGIRVRVASNDLLSAAFSQGDPDREKLDIWQLSQGISDGGALRFGTTASPEEYLVIRCVSRADTDEVARLLLRRLDAIRRQHRGTEGERMAERAEVAVIGTYVLLVVAPDVEVAIEAARRVIP